MKDRSRRGRSDGQRGASLVEVLVATALFATALASLAQLLAFSSRTNTAARSSTYATTLAEQKMETLRSLLFAFDALGRPVSDDQTDVAASEATADCAAAGSGAGTGLSPSPPGTLLTSTPGYVDYVDAYGCGLGGGTQPPDGAVYVRRWAIDPLPHDAEHSLVLQVSVMRQLLAGGEIAAPRRRMPQEARLVTMRTRKAR
jgi:type II secretory pathway pseudopilin PulG